MIKPDYKEVALSYSPTPIELTEEQIKRYQDAHFQHYGYRLTKEQAAHQYAGVVRIVRIALRHRAQERKRTRYDE